MGKSRETLRRVLRCLVKQMMNRFAKRGNKGQDGKIIVRAQLKFRKTEKARTKEKGKSRE